MWPRYGVPHGTEKFRLHRADGYGSRKDRVGVEDVDGSNAILFVSAVDLSCLPLSCAERRAPTYFAAGSSSLAWQTTTGALRYEKVSRG